MTQELFSIRIGKKHKRAQGHYFRDKVIEAGIMSKQDYYIWLALQINVNISYCHFSRLNSTLIIAAIDKTVELINSYTIQRLTEYPLYKRLN